MNPSPRSYSDANQVQRKDARRILQEYSKVIKWRNNGCESVLDVGCGPGDVTFDIILPIIPKPFGNLVGIDISESMINHARKVYGNENISFEKLDIAGETESFAAKYPEKFDHIVSTYCLHWIRDVNKTLRNIYNLLKEDGDCLLVTLTKHPKFKIYKEMSQNEKWRPYLPNPDEIFAPYLTNDDPKETLKNLVQTVEFKNHTVTCSEVKSVYSGMEEIRSNLMAVNPVYPKLKTEHERDDYFNDYLKVADQMGVFRECTEDNNNEFDAFHQLVVIYAVK